MNGEILHSSRVGEPGAPEVWVLHGILGSGRNWRAFARRLRDARPDLAFRLVDLRRHGDSHGAFPGADTLRACGDDLDRLATSLGVDPLAVVGHSFGGKVALVWAGTRPSGLSQAWVLDASPGPVTGAIADMEVVRVIQALRRIPLPIDSHASLRDLLTRSGFSAALAGWMTTNLQRDEAPDGYGWRFDLEGVEALMEDYARVDGWPILEEPPLDFHVVIAGRGDRWGSRDVARLRAAPIEVHLLEDSGHWVHVDAPDALRALLAEHLPRLGAGQG